MVLILAFGLPCSHDPLETYSSGDSLGRLSWRLSGCYSLVCPMTAVGNTACCGSLALWTRTMGSSSATLGMDWIVSSSNLIVFTVLPNLIPDYEDENGLD